MSITYLWEDLDAKLLTPGQSLGFPENFGVYRFKLANGKVGGIKIESAAGQQKKLRADTPILEKLNFFTLITIKFSGQINNFE